MANPQPNMTIKPVIVTRTGDIHNLLPEQWCSGRCDCLTCQYEWFGEWPLGIDALECPQCKSTDTDRNAI